MLKEHLFDRLLSVLSGLLLLQRSPCRDELVPIGQDSLAGGAGEEPEAADVLDEDAAHADTEVLEADTEALDADTEARQRPNGSINQSVPAL